MNLCRATFCALFTVLICSTQAQLPSRFNVPGAILLPQGRPSRPIQLEQQPQLIQRPRRPIPVRPVIEENEDQGSRFDNEVNNLGLSALQTAVRQAEEEDQITSRPLPTTIQFRPERPLPILRQDIRDNYPSERPSSVRPIARQQQEFREPQPVRVQQRQQVQPTRPPQRLAPRPIDDDDEPRKRKPVVQILRKYRTDNADGSITWGFENEDGTFKEETIGVDCIIRGKYGYVDPDGVKREYSYESGNPCDQPEEDEDLPPQIQGRKEPPTQQGKKIQYRPAPIGQ